MHNSKKNCRDSVVKNEYLEKLKKAVSLFLKDEDVKVVLFGSRARGDVETTSDIDLGIIPGKKFDRRKLILFREVFSVGAVNEEETMKLLEMIDDGNMTSHTYKEEVAKIIYGRLKEYSDLMGNIIKRFHS